MQLFSTGRLIIINISNWKGAKPCLDKLKWTHFIIHKKYLACKTGIAVNIDYMVNVGSDKSLKMCTCRNIWLCYSEACDNY